MRCREASHFLDGTYSECLNAIYCSRYPKNAGLVLEQRVTSVTPTEARDCHPDRAGLIACADEIRGELFCVAQKPLRSSTAVPRRPGNFSKTPPIRSKRGSSKRS